MIELIDKKLESLEKQLDIVSNKKIGLVDIEESMDKAIKKLREAKYALHCLEGTEIAKKEEEKEAKD